LREVDTSGGVAGGPLAGMGGGFGVTTGGDGEGCVRVADRSNEVGELGA
jgi:hypothetical protein